MIYHVNWCIPHPSAVLEIATSGFALLAMTVVIENLNKTNQLLFKLRIFLPENVKNSIDYLGNCDMIKMYDYAHTPIIR